MGSTEITERVYLDASGKATTDEAKANSLWATPGDQRTDEEVAEVGYKAPSRSSTEEDDGPSYKDLQARAKALDLPAGGTKDEIAARIAEYEAANPET